MKPVVCFGEIMARFSPPGHLRLRQAMPGGLEVTFAGAEANAAAAIAALGGAAEFVTALPDNEITTACIATLRAAGVGVRHAQRRDAGRFGLYFVETGANQRGGSVLYDREGSAFALSAADQYPWAQVFADSGWFHTSGISASVSRPAAEATLAAVRAARAAGLAVSFDLNHRRKLWRWDPAVAPEALARRSLDAILPAVDVLVGNITDTAAAAGLDDRAADEAGSLADRAGLEAVARAVARRFPNLRHVAITLRENHSASHNRWGALLYHAADDRAWLAPETGGRYAPYDIRAIVDRVGTGDAFAGALIFALRTPELAAPEAALRFATAASCLAHSIQGDFNQCTRQEVEELMHGGGHGFLAR